MADTKISNLPVGAMVDGDEFAVASIGGVTERVTRVQVVAGAVAAAAANLAAHAAVTGAPIHGSSVATANDRLVHRSAAGDADATAFNAGAGSAAAPAFTFTTDLDTGLYRFGTNELGISTGGTHRAHWNTTGALVVNDAAASSKMTGPGVTIQQGALDDEAVAIQSTDVAHGMTTIADTDTYYALAKHDPLSGGADIRGFKDADGAAGGAARLVGLLGENADTTKTTAGRALVEAVGFIADGGTGIGNTNADGNVFGVRTRRGGAEVTLLLVDEDADLHVLNDIVVAGVVDTIDVANHVHTGGAMGLLLTAAGITDRTRKFFIPCSGGWNTDLAASLELRVTRGFRLTDDDVCAAMGFGIVPNDFVAGMTVTPVLVPDATGDIWATPMIHYGQCAENYKATDDGPGVMSAVTITLNENNCVHQVALTNPAVGDILRCHYLRDATNVLDTIGNYVLIAGWIVEYTADS